MIRKRREFRFRKSPEFSSVTLSNFTGVNTKDPQTSVTLTKADNARISQGSAIETRPGFERKGNAIATAAIQGIHSYIKKNQTAYLLASCNGEIDVFSDSVATNVIATSTSTRPTGLSKDNTVFYTNATDTNGYPYVVVIYHDGTGLILEWSSTPYSGWANTPITIAAAATTAGTNNGFDAYLDSSSNIHVVYENGGVLYYKLMTYSAGPTWSAGTARTIPQYTGGSSYCQPTVTYNGGTLYVGYKVTYGGAPCVVTYTSTDSGVTFTASDLPRGFGVSTLSDLSLKLTTSSSRPFAICQFKTALNAYFVSGSYSSGLFNFSSYSTIRSYSTTLFTCAEFSVYCSGNSVIAVYDSKELNSATSNGVSITPISSGNSLYRVYTAIVDGVNDVDIGYYNVTNGTIDSSVTRLTTTANNNLYYKSVPAVSSVQSFIPVVMREGTASPYNIRITSTSNWSSVWTGLSSSAKVNSTTMPLTAAGGTDSHYFVNGVNANRKWDGTTATAATAAGHPVSSFIWNMDQRLWMNDVTTNALYYTDRGADNFAGTFPSSTNRLDLPDAPVWGLLYRDSQSLVWTRTGVYVIQNYDYSGATITLPKKIPDSFGTLSGRTVKQIGYWVYYQRPDGQVMRTNGQYAELVSNEVFPTLSAISKSALTNAAAGVFSSYYYLSVTQASSAQNDLVAVLDTRFAPNSGWTFDTGKYISCFENHVDSNGTPVLYFGDARANGQVYLDGVGFSDAGTAINLDIQTGILPLSGIFYKDTIRDILLVAEASGNYTLNLGIATLSYPSNFTNYSISLNPQSGTWGTGTWGTGYWGGLGFIEYLLKSLFIADRGFKIKLSNSTINQPVSVVSLSINYEKLVDRP